MWGEKRMITHSPAAAVTTLNCMATETHPQPRLFLFPRSSVRPLTDQHSKTKETSPQPHRFMPYHRLSPRFSLAMTMTLPSIHRYSTIGIRFKPSSRQRPRRIKLFPRRIIRSSPSCPKRRRGVLARPRRSSEEVSGGSESRVVGSVSIVLDHMSWEGHGRRRRRRRRVMQAF